MSILGKEVPLKDVRKELKALFPDDDTRTHASLMNLAVFTEDATKLEEMYQQVAELTHNHSCRALSIALDRDAADPKITSWVSAHCNMTNGKKTVCCEHLSFLLEGYVTGRLRNTIFSLINSDLPLVFWWQGELSNVLEPRLYTLIDRFIFDSTEWADPLASYQLVLEARKEVQRRFVIQDLAWTRSYAYRLAFAAMFDNHLVSEELPNICEAFVQVQKGKETSGLLLLSWLATQAGWTLIRGAATSGVYEFKNQAGDAIHTRINIGGETEISQLGVISPSASFLLSTDSATGNIEQTLITSHGTQRQLTGAATQGKIALVEDQLSRGGKNALLRKVIPLFLELLAAK